MGFGWGAIFGGSTAAGGGGNPYPGAVGGVYQVANAAALTAKPAFSAAYTVTGETWVTGGGGVWQRLATPQINDASELPQPTGSEIFATSCVLVDAYGNQWTGDGGTAWLRVVFATVNDFVDLPSPQIGETFTTGALCLTTDLAVTYQWDGSAWGLP
jgi:hypothetical protein